MVSRHHVSDSTATKNALQNATEWSHFGVLFPPMVYLSTQNFEAVKSRDLKPPNQRQHNANHNIITNI